MSSSFRNMRGGGWNFTPNNLAAVKRINQGLLTEASSIGFRVASIPKPSTDPAKLAHIWEYLLFHHRRPNI